jgi:hypothetical protein|tara:strand:+ start:34 stop:654 length:621 start_codon:yes stop_codon:yes gene_type:complete
MDLNSLLSGNLQKNLFDYTDEEVKEFHSGFDQANLKAMYEAISKGLSMDNISDDYDRKLNRIINYLATLSIEDLDEFEKNYLDKHQESNPNMLWNMLSESDKKLYKTPHKFYDWFSKLDDDILDKYIQLAADGDPLHPEYVYKKDLPTQVHILDGFITICSSNLQALDKFRDRVLLTNNCTYEHRIKKVSGVEIHSYVFNMNTRDE